MHKRRKTWSCFYRLVVVFNLAATAALGLSRPDFLADLRNSVFDRFQRLDPAGFDPDSPVRVAAIDERSLGALGQWPWPRTRLAELTDRLREMGAAAVAFDVVFAEPDRLNPDSLAALLPNDTETQALAEKLARTPSNDSRFATALAKAPSVLGLSFLSAVGSAPPAAPRMPPKAGFAMAGDDSAAFFPAFAGIAAPLPTLADAAAGLGAINWIPDHDQVVRRVPLVARLGDHLFPALSLEALRLASGASTIVVRGSNASGQSDFGARTGVNAIKIGDLTIPTDGQGAIRPRFSLSDPRRMISIAALLRGEVAEDEIKGRIVLVGPTAAGLGDIKATPLEAAAPGVEIHAQILEQMLSGALLARPDWSPGAELVAALLLTLLMALILPALSPLAGGAAGALIVAGLFGGAFMAFSKSGLLLDPAQPSLSVSWQTLTGLLALWRAEIASRRHIQTAFGKYLSPVVVERLAEQPERLALGGETRELTVMFADLRDFTKLSEGLDAQEVTRLMNAFLTPMTEAILAAEGTIDKYIGDAIMAFWNAPLDVADHPRLAVAAALAMRSALEALNRARQENAGGDVLPLRMGIGLNLGPCSVGNMGSARRFDYSALGDNVNLASRLEGASKAYGVDIIAAQAVAERAPDAAWLDLGGLAVKGRAAPTRVLALAGDAALAATEAFQAWRRAHTDMLSAYHAVDFARAARIAETLEASAAPDWRALYRVFKTRFTALAEEERSEAPAALLALDAK
ncbi:adenylate/guanylate cyclase domain-containing protein [Rhodoblastus sp. 17X3]|uniref:CHASE2 domain-containing protein n=1 Tax=Rhodoblastus sp. 17X3 TaxID=3047026 RepID=UPI0024B6AA7E|nr:adenylate/guanylate cyclase domain-containing protein [Rhodoblastus sp. 17X3]MDI9849555.1 adenylate/guanylate cyclase domain-containing protein [Rhodoblastus sp. 17X3]